MAISRDIDSLVRRKKHEIMQTIGPDGLFQSSEYANHSQVIVDSVTGNYKIPIKLDQYWGDVDGDVACTNGRLIRHNLQNSVAYSFTDLENMYRANDGVLFHECAHIIFSDFDESKKAVYSLQQGEFYNAEPDAFAQEDIDLLNEMKDYLQKEEYRSIFMTMYSNFDNIISDQHDENALINRNGGFVEECILIAREGLRKGLLSLEDMIDQDSEPLSIIFSLSLQYARFGYAVVADEGNKKNNEFLEVLYKMAPFIDNAVATDNPYEKADCINEILLKMWPFIKEILDKQENSNDQDSSEQQDSDEHDNGQGLGGGQNSSSSTENQNPSESGTPQQSQSPSPQSAIQNILDQLEKGSKNSGGTAAPQNAKSSSEARKNSRAAVKAAGSGQENSDIQSGSNTKKAQQASERAADLSQNGDGKEALDSIMSSIAQSLAEDSVSQEIISAGITEINAVDQNSTHSGRTVKTIMQTDVTKSDINLYNSLMEELAPYSKNLQKKMQQMLRDLQDGTTVRNLPFGNTFEARDAYRPDKKYFSNKKGPQDLPNMAIAVLVDHSGSMRGERLYAAMKASMLLYDFATHLGIPVSVAGHNTITGGIQYYQYSDYNKVSESEKYRLAKMVCGRCNRDGMAIEISANRLSNRPEDVKLFIIISDGQPNDASYGGTAAAEDIRSIVKKYKKKGVETIAAAIGGDKDRIKAIYGEGSFLDIESLESLPKTLVNLVRKRII